MEFRSPKLAGILAAALLAAWLAVPAHAQGPSSNQQEQAAPYDDQFVRLSELLGAIHYLRNLCGAVVRVPHTWRYEGP